MEYICTLLALVLTLGLNMCLYDSVSSVVIDIGNSVYIKLGILECFTLSHLRQLFRVFIRTGTGSCIGIEMIR